MKKLNVKKGSKMTKKVPKKGQKRGYFWADLMPICSKNGGVYKKMVKKWSKMAYFWGKKGGSKIDKNSDF